ncbi:MAG: methionyl-tRNA formyltransferase [Clostridia bacterium]|jgi:methionyl-tRNA formyltransferase|nr:methionyl-tRNA formyltransferase [Clostridia bacterium]
MRIVFMGTPQFAVSSLNNLIESDYDIAAVFTQPDRKSGRGHKLNPPPVKVVAQENDIPVLQFSKIKSPQGVAALKVLQPDIIVTAAFGQILSKEILDIPKLGCINVHASLLPKYRGAAPIQWAIINGETQTGVTIMYMDVGLDTGDIISAESIEITDNMTGGDLYDKLAVLGADLLIETLRNVENGSASRTKQIEEQSSYYPMLNKKLGRIDWTKSAEEIRNLVRGLFPIMSAYTYIGDDMYKIREASVEQGTALPGQIVCADAKQGLLVGTGKDLLRVDLLQAPGSKSMDAIGYLCGKSITAERFE